MAEILKQEEIKEILSKEKYWNEVWEREDRLSVAHILGAEAREVINKLGPTRVMWILLDYAISKNDKAVKDA